MLIRILCSRVGWLCDALNDASCKAALRLGFREEGVFALARAVGGSDQGYRREGDTRTWQDDSCGVITIQDWEKQSEEGQKSSCRASTE
jgi:RimJ/RimL family protein N-acetyltransferase